ncbi:MULTISPECIES: peptidoglycan bridge formation glycyltransferase FemA/FemB family protein [unclassified Streptococcus]|uniref:peptidoglycan bridge formation glycyltransferase FemA/FemB family protein n=1 Tax=unclassified Streptococcus TaxID=2608887 RepID=UPI001071C345|nr:MULTISPECIES: peptidoglycan bridge formation glycyltransferase FemA/FemB family protein [unclassified Streptococcus]MBF0787644.1 aminoacyltransferase [Streptococcus sp. 19428wC2_LYSM12]MCQ9212217.1 aminoacyltransferase [Streptococcus sp. B01]MCQ9213547.1 aminoacyltransferase [Streptococcus sp. O1]TFV05367.1 aminoacyltransferase [Streptococcus sp. LYSM12]
MSFTILTKEEFIAHTAQASRLSFMQTPEMADLFAKRGAEVDYVGYRATTGEIAVSALVYTLKMAGGLHMEINAGPVSTDATYIRPFYQKLRSYAKTKGALELVVKPYDIYQQFDSYGTAVSPEQTDLIATLTDLGYQFDGLQTGYPDGEPSWHYVKDLSSLDTQSLLTSFNKNSQRNIKKAKQLGINVRALKRHELDTFAQLVQETGKRQGFSSKDHLYYQHFFDSFQTKTAFLVAEIQFTEAIKQLQVTLTTASSKQEKTSIEKAITLLKPFAEHYGDEIVPLAGGLMIYLPSEVTYLFGGSAANFQKLAAPFLLQYTAMLQGIETQVPTYNFLGISGLFDGSDGVLRFKQNFNGAVFRLTGTFRYYPHPLKAKFLTLVKKILGR